MKQLKVLPRLHKVEYSTNNIIHSTKRFWVCIITAAIRSHSGTAVYTKSGFGDILDVWIP